MNTGQTDVQIEERQKWEEEIVIVIREGKVVNFSQKIIPKVILPTDAAK